MDPVYPGWLKKVFSWMPFLMTIQRLFFFYMVEGWALLWLTKVLASKNKLTFLVFSHANMLFLFLPRGTYFHFDLFD